jgi:protein-tyrosine phosphatase
MNPSPRTLYWPGCLNVRDLGGLPTEDGRLTQTGSLIRADLLSHLTTEGKQALLDYGVRTIVDLRGPQEIAENPPPRFGPGIAAPRTINPPQRDARWELDSSPAAAKLKKARTRTELFIMVLDLYPDKQAGILRTIALAGPGPLVFHCHSGKDRTGIAAALLLDLAGAREEAIAEDYALSQGNLWAGYQERVQEGRVDPNDRWAIPLTDPQTIHDLLAHLRDQYGGTEAYLRAAGLTSEEIGRLRSRLAPKQPIIS